MCEWPLGVDAGQTADLAARAAGAGLGTLIGLQARMAPSIRYARNLVAQGYVGEVLATTLVGSGIAWTSVTDSAHAYMFEAAGNATLLSVPTMHALDALQFVLGDLADIRATSAVRRPAVTLADSLETITATAPDHLAIAATLKSGAVASVFYRGGTSRGDNFRWEINGTEGDLVLTSPVGNLQVLAPRLEGGRGEDRTTAPLRFRRRTIWRPVLRKARRPTHAPLRRLCRRSPRRHARRHRTGLRACPSCASHAGLHYDRGGERHRATSCDGDTDMRVMAVRRAGGPDVLELVDVPEPTPGPGQALVEVARRRREFHGHRRASRSALDRDAVSQGARRGGRGTCACRGRGRGRNPPGRTRRVGLCPGSYAEHVIVPAAALVPLPDAIDDRTAAAVMMQGLTASHFATDFYPVQPGDVALVHAAAGGVGLLLTQIIKRRGGRVIGRVSRQEKVHAAIEAGADHVIVGTEGDFADEVIRLSGGDGVHVVYDGSGPTTFQGSLASLRRSGTFCWYGPVLGAPGPIDIMSLPHSIKIGYAVFSDHVPTPEALRARSEQLFDWILRGELKVRIGATYPSRMPHGRMPTWRHAAQSASCSCCPRTRRDATMGALRVRSEASRARLRTAPAPGPGEALVAVDAVSLNDRDNLIMANRLGAEPPLPLVPASDMAGVVVDVGADCWRQRLSGRRPADWKARNIEKRRKL